MRWERVTGWLGGYPLVVLSVSLATAVCLPFRTSLPPQAFMLLFVPVIVGLATLLGTRASALAAVLSMVAIDFFLIRPFHTLTIASPTEWIALIVFLVIALISGHQTGRIREREVAAVHRQEELALLNRLSLKVAGADSVREIAEFIVVKVAEVLETPRAALFLTAGDPRAPFASAGAEASPDEASFVEWVLRNDKAVGLPATPDPLAERPIGVGRSEAHPGAVADGAYVPLQTTGRLEGVLYARSGAERTCRPRTHASSSPWPTSPAPSSSVSASRTRPLMRARSKRPTASRACSSPRCRTNSRPRWRPPPHA